MKYICNVCGRIIEEHEAIYDGESYYCCNLCVSEEYKEMRVAEVKTKRKGKTMRAIVLTVISIVMIILIAKEFFDISFFS